MVHDMASVQTIAALSVLVSHVFNDKINEKDRKKKGRKKREKRKSKGSKQRDERRKLGRSSY